MDGTCELANPRRMKLKLAWLSDLHFNFLSEATIEAFMATVREAADAIVITGDISVSPRLYRDLARFGKIEAPVYFVVGDHDYHRGGFSSTASVIKKAEDDFRNLCWLDDRLIVTLRPGLGLIGHGGWPDGRAGNGLNGITLTNDFVIVEDLKNLEWRELRTKVEELGNESAQAIKETAAVAVQFHDHLLILTHVPPFSEACMYQGKSCAPAFLPHLVNVALGDVLIELAAQNPDKTLTVLCGHTHFGHQFRAAPNLWVKVAATGYGRLQIADVLHL